MPACDRLLTYYFDTLQNDHNLYLLFTGNIQNYYLILGIPTKKVDSKLII